MSCLQPRFRYVFILFAVVLTAVIPAAVAQFPGMQPKHYPWSDTSLSADARADLVLKEMTLGEKISGMRRRRSSMARLSAANCAMRVTTCRWVEA